MNYRSVSVPSLITPITKQDTLFCGSYTVDPYQQCEFACRYCDSATDEIIFIKSNAIELFEKEIQHLPKGVLIIGSVHDPYQPAEKTYQITQKILELINKYNYPCHILTKSTLVLRDIDILSALKNCTVTISFITMKKTVSDIVEPQVPSPQERLHIIQTLADHHINTGLALIPVLPYIIDDELETIVQSAASHHARYFLHTYLQLKGDQKLLFLKNIEQYFPDLIEKYNTLYDQKTTLQNPYTIRLDKKLAILCKKHGIATKVC